MRLTEENTKLAGERVVGLITAYSSLIKLQRAMTERKRPVQITAQHDFASLPDPLGANYFQLSRLGGDFVLQVGWMNVPEIVDILGKSGESSTDGRGRMDPMLLEMTPKVTHQFLMSKSGFVGLYRQISNLVEQLRKQDEWPKQLPEADDEA